MAPVSRSFTSVVASTSGPNFQDGGMTSRADVLGHVKIFERDGNTVERPAVVPDRSSCSAWCAWWRARPACQSDKLCSLPSRDSIRFKSESVTSTGEPPCGEACHPFRRSRVKNVICRHRLFTGSLLGVEGCSGLGCSSDDLAQLGGLLFGSVDAGSRRCSSSSLSLIPRLVPWRAVLRW